MRRHPKNLLTAALLGTTVLLGSAACGSESTDPDPGAATSASNPAASSVSPPPTSADQMPTVSGLLKPVVLVQGGGIAGVKDRVEVQPDGTYTVTTKGKEPRQGKLDERQLTTIAAIVQRANLPELAKQPPITPTVTQSDQFTYELSADGATVRANETTLPDAAKPLVAELSTLLSAPAPTP